MERTTSMFADALGRVVAFLPNLLSALVIVGVGLLLSWGLAALTRRVLGRVGFDRLLARHVDPRVTTRARPSRAMGSVVFWIGALVTISLAANALHIPALSAGINRILAFVPRVLVAAIILAVGFGLARVVGDLVAGTTGAWPSRLARGGIMVLAIFMALDQLGVARNIVTITFTAFLGALAVACAIAFGVGNRDLARRYTGRWIGRMEAETGDEGLEEPLPRTGDEGLPPEIRH